MVFYNPIIVKYNRVYTLNNRGFAIAPFSFYNHVKSEHPPSSKAYFTIFMSLSIFKGGVSDGKKINLSEIIPIYQITVYNKSAYKHPVSSIPSYQLLLFFLLVMFKFFLTSLSEWNPKIKV